MLNRDDVDPVDALENRYHADGLTIDGGPVRECDDPYDDVCDRIDRERAARRRRW